MPEEDLSICRSTSSPHNSHVYRSLKEASLDPLPSMLRCLEVSRLPRPARLRCRPTLISAITRRGYGMPARKPIEEQEEHIPRLGPRAVQYEDYQLALKHALDAKRNSPKPGKLRPLLCAGTN